MFIRSLFFLILMLPCTLAATKAHAAFGDKSSQRKVVADPKDPLTASGKFQPSTIEAGGTAELVVDMELAENFHAYLERFKVTIEAPDDLKIADYKITPLVKFMDVVTKTEKEGVAGKSTLRALVEVPQGFAAGTQNARVKLTYQACTEDHCLFPKSVFLEVPFQVTAGAALSTAGKFEPLRPKNELESAISKSALAAFLLVFAVGFLTSLTPCVYPMIPITLAILGARAKGNSHAKNFALSLVYVNGIALTYSILGLIVAMTGGLFGAALGNIYVVTAIALIFVAMALSMFGLFEIQAPAFIRNQLGAAKTTHGFAGAFAAGLIAGVVASPCTGPVLISLLAYIAQSGSKVFGFALLFTFSYGMGLPFIALGLSSSWLSKMPKAGSWMEGVKVFFGVVMIGMAFYYVRLLYPAWLLQLLVGLTLVLFSSFYGALTPLALGTTTLLRLRKGVMLSAFAAGVALISVGALTRAGVLAPVEKLTLTPTSSTLNSPMSWKPYSLEALAEAAKAGRPVLVDFSAEWCGACHEMDETTFIDKRIVEAGKNFDLLRVDGTEDTPALREILERYKVQGFPTYLFFNSKGAIQTDRTVLGYLDSDAFLKKMQGI
jgi:thiol:disulfide interchange protein DsbD